MGKKKKKRYIAGPQSIALLLGYKKREKEDLKTFVLKKSLLSENKILPCAIYEPYNLIIK